MYVCACQVQADLIRNEHLLKDAESKAAELHMLQQQVQQLQQQLQHAQQQQQQQQPRASPVSSPHASSAAWSAERDRLQAALVQCERVDAAKDQFISHLKQECDDKTHTMEKMQEEVNTQQSTHAAEQSTHTTKQQSNTSTQKDTHERISKPVKGHDDYMCCPRLSCWLCCVLCCDVVSCSVPVFVVQLRAVSVSSPSSALQHTVHERDATIRMLQAQYDTAMEAHKDKDTDAKQRIQHAQQQAQQERQRADEKE